MEKKEKSVERIYVQLRCASDLMNVGLRNEGRRNRTSKSSRFTILKNKKQNYVKK